MYLRELLRMMEPEFYAHVLLQDDALDMLFCHRWLLLCFKREFFNEEVLKMWEACWSRHQTDYFHIFLCVAMVGEYGREVVAKDMPADEMLQYFTNLSMNMDGLRVLRKARQLLLKFRQLPGIPCTVRGLLSGTGVWDSAPLPEIECNCHGNCCYGRSSWQSAVSEETDEEEGIAVEEEKEKYEEESSEKRVIEEQIHNSKEDSKTEAEDSDDKFEETNDNGRTEKGSEEQNEDNSQCTSEKDSTICAEQSDRRTEGHKGHSNTDRVTNGETAGTNGLDADNGESHVNGNVQSEEEQGKAMSEERESYEKQGDVSSAS